MANMTAVTAFAIITSARLNFSPHKIEYVFDSPWSQLLNDDCFFMTLGF